MKLERKNIEFPLWRKKVDKSLFDHKGTTIPAWACTMWNIQGSFSHVNSKKLDDSKVKVTFEGVTYSGNVTSAHKGRKTPAYRLWFNESLKVFRGHHT